MYEKLKIKQNYGFLKKMRKHKKKSLTYQALLKSSLGQEEGEQ